MTRRRIGLLIFAALLIIGIAAAGDFPEPPAK
jgi:hypothetical protein